jgi:hypothetical protein
MDAKSLRARIRDPNLVTIAPRIKFLFIEFSFLINNEIV